jgi:hypothetical protein
MPVKRRSDKRRLDPRAEARAWADLFEFGIVFFDDDTDELTRLTGVAPDTGGRLPAEVVEPAWHRLAPYFLAARDREGAPWALVQFGMPTDAR